MKYLSLDLDCEGLEGKHKCSIWPLFAPNLEMADFGDKSGLKQLLHSKSYLLNLNLRTQYCKNKCEVFLSE